MTRRRFTALDRLKVMVRQAICPRCGERLGRLDDTEFDHPHALALGGEDSIDNLVALHVACHKTKTNGTKATTAGSDKHMIAKMKRIEAAQRRLLTKDGEPKPPRKKIPSRPFQKRRKGDESRRNW